MPPCLPIPIFSIIRKFLVKLTNRSWSSRIASISFAFRSLALPTFGYTLIGWSTTRTAPSDAYSLPNDAPGQPLGPNTGEPGNNKPPPKGQYNPKSTISLLINNPTLFDPLQKPRNPIVLCHGLYGFDVRGFDALPSLQIHYWSDVLRVLRKRVGAEVFVSRVPGTGSVVERATAMREYLKEHLSGRTINFIGHSMGGLDCRYLIAKLRPREYSPASLITLSTPHRGSPFMDWLMQYIGLGSPRNTAKPIEPTVPLPSSIVSFIDSPAYANLTSTYMEEDFNPNVPDLPSVKYWSVAARTDTISFFHPLWLPKLIVDSFQEKQWRQHTSPTISLDDWGSDGLVTVESAKWGEFLGILEECDHWDVRGAGGFSGHSDWNMNREVEKSSKWSWSDWQSFLRAWSKGRESEKANHPEAAAKAAELGARVLGQKYHFSQREKEDFVPSAMSAVLDWVVDNVPGISAVHSPLKMVVEKALPSTPKDIHRTPPKFDLERFYVALCRKLYDEGL